MSTAAEPERSTLTWVVLPPAVNLAALGLVTWGTTNQIEKVATVSGRVAATVLLVVAAGAWLGWVGVRQSGRGTGRADAVAIVVMALAGGALVGFAPVAAVFPAVAALVTAMRWPFPAALAIGGLGWLAAFSAVEIAGHSLGGALGAAAAVFGGLLVGSMRQQTTERAAQSARMEVETARAEAQQARAEVLSERNHLARELHDVLAHTLAALSLQLEAFATVVDGEPGVSPAVRQQLEKTRQLVREGLGEARGAVRALREDPAPLEDQVAKLSARQDARFAVEGSPRPLPARVVTNMYRVAQEAMTNAMKHAPGAPTFVTLRYGQQAVSLMVENELADSGSFGNGVVSGNGSSGYGLRGIAERLELVGGHVEAGPHAGRWRVAATVPLVDGSHGGRPEPAT